MMYIAIFNSKDHKIYGSLCKYVTGYADYHVGITDLTSFWDQDILFRKRQWMPRPVDEVTLYECPVNITSQELDDLVISGVEQLCIEKSLRNLYGFLDYALFGLRKFGLFTKVNLPGIVCSGRVRNILYSYGWKHLGSSKDAEPSPADIRRKFNELGYKVIKQGRLD